MVVDKLLYASYCNISNDLFLCCMKYLGIIYSFIKHPWVKNRYTLTLFAFLMWMLFFDEHDTISQTKHRGELHQLEEDKKYYRGEISKTKADLDELMTNPEKLEKFAREKYLMKKDDEEVFVIVKGE